MHRWNLLDLLRRYRPGDAADAACRDRIAAFVRSRADCFERRLASGHLTGSGWLLDPARQRALLVHHRKLRRWLQPGGHADGNPDLLAVACREAREESGIRDIRPLEGAILDLDVHVIPRREREPAHLHYDVRFLLAAGSDTCRASAESLEVAWFRPAEILRLDTDASVLRMCAKWMQHRDTLRKGARG